MFLADPPSAASFEAAENSRTALVQPVVLAAWPFLLHRVIYFFIFSGTLFLAVIKSFILLLPVILFLRRVMIRALMRIFNIFLS